MLWLHKQTLDSFRRKNVKMGTVVPLFPQGICAKTPSGCLKPQIVPNLICTISEHISIELRIDGRLQRRLECLASGPNLHVT